MNDTATKQILYLSMVAFGIFSVDHVQCLSLRLSSLAKIVNGGTINLAIALVAAVFVCGHVGTDTRDFVVSRFLEPARIGLEAVMSKIDFEN